MRCSCDERASVNVLSTVTEVFRLAIQRAYPGAPDDPIVQPSTTKKSRVLGQYQCNAAMKLTQFLNKVAPLGMWIQAQPNALHLLLLTEVHPELLRHLMPHLLAQGL